MGVANLKLLIDRENKRVLFAEAGKEFVDFILHILALPIGTITRLINVKDMVGSIGNLYSSIENLSDMHLKSNLKRNSWNLTHPAMAHRILSPCLLQLARHTTGVLIRTTCAMIMWQKVGGTSCPECRSSVGDSVTLVQARATRSTKEGSSKGGYVEDDITYMVLDDLTVKPMSTISCVSLLTKFNIKDLGVLEEREINVSWNEAVKLLKASLQSKRVLSDAFLGNKEEVKLN